ncbi:aldose 1-epimerase family protein [Hymenobacter busanensis]|uniref:Aldose 1-epimerase family protein n=1 Tax=Hymenobacter busanensis TaxID=2607656 RepID=A0A7L5A4G7_9BACT|nr:aldose 1-epimerase family protein [Hymenobacter busanensis]KAA9338561.1 aldose 1-epimerase family protein [Hymenobacter busanensis]QHJ09010.1 aldose 1-epimerase family protein [Hymenobacter busanensis]
MTYFLENDRCRVGINQHGAELSSFVRKDLGGLEYLWQADAAVWARHAPVLFPIVGRLPEDTYYHNGQAYRLPQHGFARDREFALVQQSADHLVFRLTDDEASHAAYPFAFELDISYHLVDSTLHVGWRVHNPSAAQELLFSIGAHPAFRCPLLPDEQFEDYAFRVDHPVQFDQYLLAGGLLTGETEPVFSGPATELPLTYPLFERDALVLKHYDFTQITLASARSPRAVRMKFEGFPYLGLWTKGAGAPFVCIEPWHGVASSVGAPSELRDKEGILTLAPGRAFEASYSISAE